MTTSTMRKILWISVVGSTLALGACGGGADGKTASKDTKETKGTKDKKGGDAKGGDAKPAPLTLKPSGEIAPAAK